jgi:hypothetical protein
MCAAFRAGSHPPSTQKSTENPTASAKIHHSKSNQDDGLNGKSASVLEAEPPTR